MTSRGDVIRSTHDAIRYTAFQNLAGGDAISE